MCGFLLWPAYCWHLVREARATRARRELRENLTSVSVATSGQRARGGTANGRGGRGRWESEMKQASRPASAAYSKPAQRGSHYISSNPAAVVINGSPKLEVSQRPSVVTPAGVAPPTLPASAGLHHARTASVVRALPPLTSPEQGSDGAAARGAHSSWGTLRGAVSTTAAWKMYREGAQMRPQRASAVLPRGFAAGLEGGGRQSRSASLVPGSRNESQRSLLSGGGAGTAHAPSNTASATAAAAPAPWPPTHEGLPSRDEYLFTDRGNRCASNDRRGVG